METRDGKIDENLIDLPKRRYLFHPPTSILTEAHKQENIFIVFLFFSFLFSFSISVRFNYVELILERYSTQMLQLFLALANICDRGKGKARKRRFFPNCLRNFSMDFPSENHEIPFRFSLS